MAIGKLTRREFGKRLGYAVTGLASGVSVATLTGCGGGGGSGPSPPQKITLEGKITDMFSDNPLNGAEVWYNPLLDTTDIQGEYWGQVDSPFNGRLTVKASGHYDSVGAEMYASSNTTYDRELVPQDAAWLAFFDAVCRGVNGATQRWATQPTWYLDVSNQSDPAKVAEVRNVVETDLPLFTDGFVSGPTVQEGIIPPSPGTTGYVVVEWSGVASHYEYLNGNEIYSGDVELPQAANLTGQRNFALHELGQVLGAIMNSDLMPSMFNSVPILGAYQPCDLKAGEFLYSRNPGNTSPDTES